jgi:hypothetical protein
MARDPNRLRWEYFPGPTVVKLLDEIAALPGPKLGRQDLIEKLIIWGAWCAKKEQDRPPSLFGTNRARWRS